MKICSAFLVFLLSLIPAVDSLHFSPVARPIVESRFRRYQGNNEQRESTLKQLFTEAGCDAGHLTDNLSKGPNFPTSSARSPAIQTK
jgi:hypothetical protein